MFILNLQLSWGLKMNKAFKKYGKVNFKSIVPSRFKRIRAMRIAMSASIAAASCANISSIRCVQGGKIDKVMAIADSIASSKLYMIRAMTRSDHPIHKKAAN